MRQAGTITNMTVIQCRFYDLTHVVATLISFRGIRAGCVVMMYCGGDGGR